MNSLGTENTSLSLSCWAKIKNVQVGETAILYVFTTSNK